MASIAMDADLAREVIGKLGSLRTGIKGGSMGPWIVSGDSLVIEPVRAHELAIGDIAVFESHGQLIAHRVLRREQDRWVTRGDSLERADPPVEDDRIVGRVRGLHLRWVVLDHPPVRLSRAFGRVVLRVSPQVARVRRILGR